MDKTTHEVRLANWKSIIEQCQQRPEGQTAKQWKELLLLASQNTQGSI